MSTTLPQYKELSDAETKQETQRLLLSGKWRMLGESCPITHLPLFLNKENGMVWSVKLQMPVKIESQATAGATTESPSTAPAAETPAPVSSTEISARIGQKLLQGWELLNEVGEDGVPLMKDLQGNLWSPTQGDMMSNLPQQSNNDEEEEEEIPEHDPLPPMRGEDDAVSQRIGQKLLLGWTMLAENCPVTMACPLFRDPSNGKMWSAALNDYLPEDEKKRVKVQDETAKPPAAVLTQVYYDDDEEENDKVSTIVQGILKGKMLAWARELETTTDLNKTRELLAVIKDIATTLKELQTL